jgi:hypothetical protein
MAVGFGTPLDQLGQGYGNPPAGYGQSWYPPAGSGQYPPSLAMMQGGAPQNSNYTDTAGYAAGSPPNPPAGSIYQSSAGVDPNAMVAPIAGSAPSGAAASGTSTQPLPNPPAPFDYWSPRSPMAGGLNAGGFGGLRTGGGQGPGASYWARLNNIGGA